MKNERIMKTIFKTALCLSALLLAFSCTLDEIDSQMTDEEAIASIRLECDALESYTIQAKPQAVSFSVTSTTPWSVTCPDEWLTITPSSSDVSSLSEDIVVKATANEAFQDRTTTLTIKGKNTDISYQVTITQLRKGKLIVMPFTEEFEKTGGELPISIEANLAWEISAADNWLTFSESSGIGNGSAKTIQAIAEQNNSLVRETTVTVTSGDAKYQFNVTQKGEILEFEPVENTVIDRKGGEILLGVNATGEWIAETDNEDFKLEKVSNNQLKVSAAFNNKFAPRQATVTLKPASSEVDIDGGSVTFTQDINFKMEGNCEVLSDGSVKISSGAVSRVVTLDEYREKLDLKLTFGEVHFDSSAQLWVQGKCGGVNLYNQLTIGGNTRIRTDGTMANGASSYTSTKYSITVDELNAMTTYEYKFEPNASDPEKLDMAFYVNGTEKVKHSGPNPFYYDESASTYYFGFYSSTSDNTWYVVKSCDIQTVDN